MAVEDRIAAPLPARFSTAPQRRKAAARHAIEGNLPLLKRQSVLARYVRFCADESSGLSVASVESSWFMRFQLRRYSAGDVIQIYVYVNVLLAGGERGIFICAVKNSPLHAVSRTPSR